MHPSLSVFLKDTHYGPNKGGLQILDEIAELPSPALLQQRDLGALVPLHISISAKCGCSIEVHHESPLQPPGATRRGSHEYVAILMNQCT